MKLQPTRGLFTLPFLVIFAAGVHGQMGESARTIANYGAKPDGRTFNTKAINQAINDCSGTGGGTVVIPPGDYLSGPIQLLKNVTLNLEAGAVLIASTNLEDYPLETGHASGEPTRTGFITARNESNIGITGRGMIEGNGMAWVDPTRLKQRDEVDFEKKYTRQQDDFMNPKYGIEDGPLLPRDRPGNFIRLYNCTNILVSGVTIRNSPGWGVEIAQSERVNITGVSINSFASNRRVPNDDGMDLVQSSDVHISDCDVQTGDDCIAVLGGQNVTVANCTLSSRSAAIRVGFAGADIRDCVFANIVIHDSNRGVAVNVRGPQSVENVLFSDIVMETRLMTGHWWGKGEPIQVSALPWATNHHIGHIRNVRFRNILAESESGIIVYGCEQSVIQDLSFQEVKVRIKNSSLQQSYGGNFDLRGGRDAAEMLFAHDIPAFYCRYAEGVKVHSFEVEWSEGLPSFFTHAIQLESARDIDIDSFRGGPAHKDGVHAAIALSKVGKISIRNSTASKGTGAFVSFAEVTDGGLFTDNDLAEARKVSEPGDLPFQVSGNRPPKQPRNAHE
jgi:polygalacturonase